MFRNLFHLTLVAMLLINQVAMCCLHSHDDGEGDENRGRAHFHFSWESESAEHQHGNGEKHHHHHCGCSAICCAIPMHRPNETDGITFVALDLADHDSNAIYLGDSDNLPNGARSGIDSLTEVKQDHGVLIKWPTTGSAISESQMDAVSPTLRLGCAIFAQTRHLLL